MNDSGVCIIKMARGRVLLHVTCDRTFHISPENVPRIAILLHNNTHTHHQFGSYGWGLTFDYGEQRPFRIKHI